MGWVWCHFPLFNPSFGEEMDQYIKAIRDDEELADGIALTRALKANFFAVIVGIECNIPASELKFM